MAPRKEAVSATKITDRKAIDYAVRHWDVLTRFCEDGRYLIARKLNIMRYYCHRILVSLK
jgi:uncharacterized protein (DUF924 family)